MEENLQGMTAQEAREYIFHHLTTLKLTEKKRDELKVSGEKWVKRIELAKSAGKEDLAQAALVEAERNAAALGSIDGEIAELKRAIESMRKQIPALAARERSIDPDLLEQELRIALGKDLSGDEDLDKAFEQLEREAKP